jgi:hypothetical protein
MMQLYKIYWFYLQPKNVRFRRQNIEMLKINHGEKSGYFYLNKRTIVEIKFMTSVKVELTYMQPKIYIEID